MWPFTLTAFINLNFLLLDWASRRAVGCYPVTLDYSRSMIAVSVDLNMLQGLSWLLC